MQPYKRPRPLRLNIMAFCPEHPMWDQNPKFTPLSETTSTPTPFIWEFPRGNQWCLYFFKAAPNRSFHGFFQLWLGPVSENLSIQLERTTENKDAKFESDLKIRLRKFAVAPTLQTSVKFRDFGEQYNRCLWTYQSPLNLASNLILRRYF